MLLLTGKAYGNICAYNTEGDKYSLDNPFGIGILSYSTYELKIPIHESLMSPKYPVWILHGGDHFTVLFSFNDVSIDTNSIIDF